MFDQWRDRRRWRSGALSLGMRGECYARCYLRRAGYRVVKWNLQAGGGEIDILAESPDRALVIVEVKTTSRDQPGPEVHVDWRKQRQLDVLARRLVNRYRLGDRLVRFDVIGIVWPESANEPTALRHHVNAFGASV